MSIIKKVIVGDGIRIIESNAFFDFKGMHEVILPDSLEEIQGGAFSYCALEKVDIPDSVRSIGAEAFSGCALESVRLPQGIRVIEEETFSDNFSLSGIELPEDIESIGSNAFSGCAYLSTITIPENVTNIAISAFIGMGSDRNSVGGVVYFRGRVPNFDIDNDEVSATFYYPIQYRNGWDDIKTNSGLKKINMKTYDLDPDGTMFPVPDDNDLRRFTDSGCTLHVTGMPVVQSSWFDDASEMVLMKVKKIIFDGGITDIDNSVFKEYRSVETIELPETLGKIGDYAFKKCISLKGGIDFTDSVTYIGTSAFDSCNYLEKVRIPDGTYIGKYAFTNSGLKKIVFDGRFKCDTYATGGDGVVTQFLPGNTVVYCPAAYIEDYANAFSKRNVKVIPYYDGYDPYNDKIIASPSASPKPIQTVIPSNTNTPVTNIPAPAPAQNNSGKHSSSRTPP